MWIEAFEIQHVCNAGKDYNELTLGVAAVALHI